MPTNRQRHSREKFEGVSDDILYRLGDGLYPKPDDYNDAEKFWTDDEEFWPKVREQLLEDWISESPCTRPQMWWQRDAPRVTDEDINRYRWHGTPFFLPTIPDLRRRLGGVGSPSFEFLRYVPRFYHGVPTDWLSRRVCDFYASKPRKTPFPGVPINPADPPQFESEAAYLSRHNLLRPEEERYLAAHPELLEPEIIQLKEGKNE